MGVFGCVGGQDDQASEQFTIRGFDFENQNKKKRSNDDRIFIYFTILLLQMKPTLLPKYTLSKN